VIGIAMAGIVREISVPGRAEHWPDSGQRHNKQDPWEINAFTVGSTLSTNQLVASFDAISVVANTLRGVLANSRPERFAGADFKLLRTQDFQAASAQISFGISIYLHRLAFNTNRRNLPPRVAVKNGEQFRFRPPTPVDLHFLVTAWGRTAEEQMDILGWAIRTLQDTTELPAGLLNRFSGDPGDRFPSEHRETVRDQVFSDSEAIELVGEILTPQEFVNIWGNAVANQQPSVSYVARQVLIDSETELPDAGLVQTRRFEYAKLVSNGSNPSTAR
jgi:hypothetical protein